MAGLITFSLLTGALAMHAQVTVESNTIFTTSEFVGCDVNSTVELQIRHDGNFPIDWYSDAIRRMTLLPDATYTIDTFTGQVKDGSLLLSPDVDEFYSTGAPGPFSLLHLTTGDDVFLDRYRPWMGNGMTISGQGTESYIGDKVNSLGEPDLIFHLGGRNSYNRIRFLFTETYDGFSTTGSRSVDGMEFMRLYPASNTEPFVGIGDWFAAGVEPSERLDIVDGRLRIRELPEPAGEATGIYKVMVVDDTPSPSGERGVVKWLDPNDLPPGGGGSDCDWGLYPSANKLTTAWQPVGTNGVCPELDWTVGIGTNTPDAKLHVYNTVNSGVDNFTGLFEIDGSAVQKTGSRMVSSGTGDKHYGGHGLAQGGTELNTGLRGVGEILSGVTGTDNHGGYFWGVIRSGGITDKNHGVRAYAQVNGTATSNYGVHAFATGSGATTNYGIHASANQASVNWAGWFQGAVWITGNGYVNNGIAITSDANLKTGVEDVENALDLIMQLQPKTYLYDSAAHPHMGLSNDDQIGLLAQEVEAIVPEAVRSTTFPAQYDEEGNMLSEAMPVKGVVYSTLVPLLIGAVQEQQTQIEEQQATNAALANQLDDVLDRLDLLEASLAACCANPGVGDDDQRSGTIEDELPLDPATERLLTIAPNPFTDQTTVSYLLERSGRAQLMVNSSDGKHLQVLEEAARTEGQYSYAWSTAHLAPGVYYVTLLLDGEPLVKRAVKVR